MCYSRSAEVWSVIMKKGGDGAASPSGPRQPHEPHHAPPGVLDAVGIHAVAPEGPAPCGVVWDPA